ncbi:MAG: hypothetical protein WDW38_008449 [Sanguina aurantia]
MVRATDQSLETLNYRLELESAYEPWLECVEELKLAGLGQDAAERAVSKAYGWTYSAYWRGEQAEVIPALESMQESLLVLQGLGLTEAELAALLKTFPEALACHPEDQLQKNLTRLREEYKLNGKVLVKALARQPRILGYTFSCEGDCAGECHKCWARF